MFHSRSFISLPRPKLTSTHKFFYLLKVIYVAHINILYYGSFYGHFVAIIENVLSGIIVICCLKKN